MYNNFSLALDKKYHCGDISLLEPPGTAVDVARSTWSTCIGLQVGYYWHLLSNWLSLPVCVVSLFLAGICQCSSVYFVRSVHTL